VAEVVRNVLLCGHILNIIFSVEDNQYQQLYT